MINVFCIIVFYNPSEEMLVNWKRVVIENPNIIYIIIDNSSEIKWKYNYANCIYMPLLENRGIGYAQNEGIKYVIGRRGDYVLFLDQDSHFPFENVTKMIKCYTEIIAYDNKVGALGPLIVNSITGENYKNSAAFDDKGFSRVDILISSGTLVQTRVIEDVGLFDSSLFIDLVDFEWCWRAVAKGYHNYMTDRVQLLHSVGQKTITFLGIPFIISSPSRYYYKYRNTILLMKRNYVPLEWKVNNCIRLMGNIVHLFVCKDYKDTRLVILRNIFRGIFYGLCK